MNDKLLTLREILSNMDKTLAAYSGGVDSTLLVKIASDIMGDRLTAVIVTSPTLPERELLDARATARHIGVELIEMPSREVELPEYKSNQERRCYYCKDHRYQMLRLYGAEHGYQGIIDGSNENDLNDFRPGQQAALEQGVRSPLQEVGFTKSEIRTLAKQMNLPNWDKPSSACLASRIPYGIEITTPLLKQVEKAEDFLFQLGFREMRVRHHEKIARIEVLPDQFIKLLHHREEISNTLKEIGYSYITLDINGFRSGSMNEGLKTHGSK